MMPICSRLKKKFRLDSNNFGFSCAGVCNVGGYRRSARYNLSCLLHTGIWTPAESSWQFSETSYGCGLRKVFVLLYKLLICLCSVWFVFSRPRCDGVYPAVQLVDLLVFTRLKMWRCLFCFTTCWFSCVPQTQGVKVFILLYNLLICLCSVQLCSPDSRCEGVYPAPQLVDLLVFTRLKVWRCLFCSTTCWFACVHQTQGVKVFILLYNLLICLCSPDSRCEGVYLAVQGDWGSTEYQEYIQQAGAHEQAWKHQGKHLTAW